MDRKFPTGNPINDQYDIVVVGNSEIHDRLPSARYIHYSVDLDFFEYNNEPTEEKVVSMVIGRIESKKGPREVALACKNLGYKFVLAGRISNGDYFNQIMEANPDTDFRENISEDELKALYHESMVHVCNSIDGHESGTLPILEAMACGVPVLTRLIGHVPDLYDGQNLYVRSGDQEDMEDLEDALKNIVENPLLREKMRTKSWNTVKNWGEKRYAWKFEKLYYELLKKHDSPFVSVIVPTYDRPEVLAKSLSRIIAQDYPYMEVIVVDSGNIAFDLQGFLKTVTEALEVGGVKDFKLPLFKYIRFENNGEYTLPKARNLAVIESSGDLLVFCDERLGMEPGAVSAFVSEWQSDSWLFGVKDKVEKGFVENFSCVSRRDLVRSGMFNERIDCYGGATQDLRERMGTPENLVKKFIRTNKAKAVGLARSKSTKSRRKSIVRAKDIIFKLYH